MKHDARTDGLGLEKDGIRDCADELRRTREEGILLKTGMDGIFLSTLSLRAMTIVVAMMIVTTIVIVTIVTMTIVVAMKHHHKFFHPIRSENGARVGTKGRRVGTGRQARRHRTAQDGRRQCDDSQYRSRIRYYCRLPRPTVHTNK